MFLSKVRQYAEVIKKIAKEYGFPTIDMQDIFEENAKKFGFQYVLYDGTHPSICGAKWMADEWLKVFEQYIEKFSLPQSK